MDNNFLCTPIKAAALPGCDENYVNQVKTIEIGHAQYDEVKGIIEEHRATGKPLVFHVGTEGISLAREIAMATLHAKVDIGMLPVVAPKIPEPIHIKNYLEPLPILHSTQKESNEVWHKQGKAIEAADIPEGTKKLIAAEYIRLKRLHPKWKPSKAARKAGEKYNVKFVFE